MEFWSAGIKLLYPLFPLVNIIGNWKLTIHFKYHNIRLIAKD